MCTDAAARPARAGHGGDARLRPAARGHPVGHGRRPAPGHVPPVDGALPLQPAAPARLRAPLPHAWSPTASPATVVSAWSSSPAGSEVGGGDERFDVGTVASHRGGRAARRRSMAPRRRRARPDPGDAMAGRRALSACRRRGRGARAHRRRRRPACAADAELRRVRALLSELGEAPAIPGDVLLRGHSRTRSPGGCARLAPVNAFDRQTAARGPRAPTSAWRCSSTSCVRSVTTFVGSWPAADGRARRPSTEGTGRSVQCVESLLGGLEAKCLGPFLLVPAAYAPLRGA